MRGDLPRCPSTSKIMHPSRSAAIEDARKLERRHGAVGVMPYLCPRCHAWHIGHSSTSPKDRAKHLDKKSREQILQARRERKRQKRGRRR